MKRKCILVFMIVLTMGMTACSSDSKESAVLTETITEREPENEEASKTETKPDTAESPKSDNIANAGTEPTADEENIENDPITGIVEKYADDTIIIKDPGDEILYYFSTKNAQIAEGDSPIAVGDVVEITYRGLLGDEKNPGEAVKIAASPAPQASNDLPDGYTLQQIGFSESDAERFFLLRPVRILYACPSRVEKAQSHLQRIRLSQ